MQRYLLSWILVAFVFSTAPQGAASSCLMCENVITNQGKVSYDFDIKTCGQKNVLEIN